MCVKTTLWTSAFGKAVNGTDIRLTKSTKYIHKYLSNWQITRVFLNSGIINSMRYWIIFHIQKWCHMTSHHKGLASWSNYGCGFLKIIHKFDPSSYNPFTQSYPTNLKRSLTVQSLANSIDHNLFTFFIKVIYNAYPWQTDIWKDVPMCNLLDFDNLDPRMYHVSSCYHVHKPSNPAESCYFIWEKYM